MPPPTPPSVNDGRMIEREAERLRQRRSLRRAIARRPLSRHVEADLAHRVLEQLAVFGDLDRVDRRADQLDAVLLEHAVLGELDREVERRLAADGRQQRVRPLALDDRGEHFRRQRLDVGAVGELRVGHDRRRVAVDEDDLEPFGAQRLARLRAGVVELAGLPDDDRAGADDEDALDVGAFGHVSDLAAGRHVAQLQRRAPQRQPRLFHHVEKSSKQVVRVVRARRGLGMVLHAEHRLASRAAALRPCRRTDSGASPRTSVGSDSGSTAKP